MRRLLASGRQRVGEHVRRLLAKRGYELLGPGSPRHTPDSVLGHVKRMGFAPGTVIDVGVAWGTPELYSAFPSARYLLVEPLEEYRDALEALTRRLDAEYVLVAAGREPGRVTLSVHRAPVLSSTLGTWKGSHETGTTREVPVAPLDHLVAERDLPAPFLLKVDVEGGELDVLAGATRLLAQTEVVLLEVNLFEFLPKQPILHDVVAYMNACGFVTYDLYEGHLRPLDGALAMVNMVFVRKDGRFRKLDDFATPEQADQMYRSWGF